MQATVGPSVVVGIRGNQSEGGGELSKAMCELGEDHDSRWFSWF